MKKRIIRLAAILVMIATTLSLCACEPPASEPPTFDELKEEMGVSFDNIICQYSYGDIVWVDDKRDFYEDYSTNITIYADNTVRLWTSRYYGDDEAIAETTSQITEEQKITLLETLQEHNLLAFSYCSTYDVLEGDWEHDSHWGYFTFYDDDGNYAHKCGGLQPDNSDYNAAAALIREYFPYLSGDLVKLRAQTAELMPVIRLRDFIHDESGERSISCKQYAFTLYCGYDRYPFDGLEYDIDIETFYTMLPDGNLEIKVRASGYTGEYGTENFTTVTNEIVKKHNLSTAQTNELIELLKENFIFGKLLPADQHYNDIDTWLEWYGHIKLYDENGVNIFNSFMHNRNFSDDMKDAINHMLPTYNLNELKDAAAIPVAEEILSLAGTK